MLLKGTSGFLWKGLLSSEPRGQPLITAGARAIAPELSKLLMEWMAY